MSCGSGCPAGIAQIIGKDPTLARQIWLVSVRRIHLHYDGEKEKK